MHQKILHIPTVAYLLCGLILGITTIEKEILIQNQLLCNIVLQKKNKSGDEMLSNNLVEYINMKKVACSECADRP